MARSRLGAGLAALAVGALVVGCGGGSDGDEPTTTTSPATTTTSAPTTTAPAASSADLVAAACGEALVATPGAAVTEPRLTEASGIVPDGEVTWVLNDSGDRPRVYGLRADGSAQVVDVTGAEAIDWEDLAGVDLGGAEPTLWIADTGGNIAARPTVQLYRIPVPAADATTVAAERVDVTYPDGPHDVEALLALGDGSLLLLSKEPARSRLYRVAPPAGGGPVAAELVGEFRPGSGPATVVTGADLAPDGRAVAVRTYGGAFLYPVAEGQAVPDALAAEGTRCRTPVGSEAQGESIGFLADGSGYATIGEGKAPVVTVVRPRG